MTAKFCLLQNFCSNSQKVMFPHWEQPKFILKCAQPVLIAQGFKWSRCTAILTDVHALGAPLGAWKEGICGSTMPLYPTSGQWLPYRGLTWIKPLSLPPSAHLSGGRGFKPRERHKHTFLAQKFNCLHEGMLLMLKVTFLSHFLHMQLARVT